MPLDCGRIAPNGMHSAAKLRRNGYQILKNHPWAAYQAPKDAGAHLI